MANIFNRVDCASGGRNKNTGFGDCELNPTLIKGGAYVPSTFKLTKAQLATPALTIAALKAAAKTDDPANRIFPIHGFVNPSDNTEDKVIRTANDGSQSVVRDGLVNWSWEFTAGGLALHKALRTHNSNGGYFIFWDADNVLYGWGKNREIYGIPLNFKWVNPWRQNDGSNPAIYSLQVVFEARYSNQELGFAKLTSSLSDVKGLRDIAIIVNEFDGDLGTGNFSLVTEDSAYNLYDTYVTEFEDETLFAAVNDQTGEAVTVLSVIRQASDKSFDFALDTVDIDYPTSNGDTITLSMAAVSVLEAAGVINYEGLAVELEITTGSAS